MSILDRIFQHRAAKTDTKLLELKAFTLDFFNFFEAEVVEGAIDGNKEDSLVVALPTALADYFEKPTLQLTFQSSESANGRDLVAYGSRVFDLMIGYLDQHAALTIQQLPSRHAGSEVLLQGIRPLNAAIADLKMQQQIQHLYIFNWQITYRADDKREELYTVILDEHGKRLTMVDGTDSADDQNTSGADVPDGTADLLSIGVDLDQLLADAEEPTPLYNTDGQPIPLRLPPMTHLTRLAEDARKFAIYHADLRAVTHEADILPRLHKMLDRLTNYYTQQIEEVYDSHDSDGEKRAGLQRDLERKIAEEVENHRLRVEVALLSYAILQIPIATADIILNDGRQDVPIHIQHNCYDQSLRRPTCAACDKEIEGIVVCRDGQISCESCMQQCSNCQDILCETGAVSPCPCCEQANCETCSQSCWACGERACTEHLDDCPTCHDPVCHGCQVECAHCHIRQCRSHLRVDCVLADQTVDMGAAHREQHLICADCAVRCPNCQQYSAHVDSCTVTGQRFCQNCLVECTACSRQLGLSVAHNNPVDQQLYCRECLIACPTCDTLTSALMPCDRCQNECCVGCGGTCLLSGKTLCANHIYRYIECDHLIATEYQATCAIGQEEICPSCHPPCDICEQYHCQTHSTTCRRCEIDYCNDCVQRSGICHTCTTIGQTGEPIDLTDETILAHPEAGKLIPRYHWFNASTQRHTFYFGTNALMSSALIVVENVVENAEEAETGIVVRLAKKLGMVEMIRGQVQR